MAEATEKKVALADVMQKLDQLQVVITKMAAEISHMKRNQSIAQQYNNGGR